MAVWLGVALGGALAAYALVVAFVVVSGRRGTAAALVRLLPDLVVLAGRLLRDPALPRRHKLLLAGLAAYLAVPVDLVPDFVPVAGQLDDVVLVALVLRLVLRGAGPELVRRHWPGPPETLALVARLAGGRGEEPG